MSVAIASEMPRKKPKMSEDKKENKAGCYIVSAFLTFLLLVPLMWLFPSAFEPFTLFSVWTTKGGFFDWIYAAWPVFVWAIGINTLIYSGHFLARNHKDRTFRNKVLDNAEESFVVGSVTSLIAGVFEEMSFRWILFLNAMFFLHIVNFIFFGFIGLGIPELIHNWIVGPIANWTTFGALEAQIFHPATWVVGAAMLSANAAFRDGHKYQGLFGVVNSWFGGMYLFWIMFNYGLFAAIVVHFLYDLIIDITVYICKNGLRVADLMTIIADIRGITLGDFGGFDIPWMKKDEG